MADLSSSAQAVKDAFDSKWAGTRHQALVAALRAAALYCKRDSAIPLSLADELENLGE